MTNSSEKSATQAQAQAQALAERADICGELRHALVERGWFPPDKAMYAMLAPPDFYLGEFSDVASEDAHEGRLVYNPGDPSVGMEGGWELSGDCALSAYIRGLEEEIERLRQEKATMG